MIVTVQLAVSVILIVVMLALLVSGAGIFQPKSRTVGD